MPNVKGDARKKLRRGACAARGRDIRLFADALAGQQAGGKTPKRRERHFVFPVGHGGPTLRLFNRATSESRREQQEEAG